VSVALASGESSGADVAALAAAAAVACTGSRIARRPGRDIGGPPIPRVATTAGGTGPGVPDVPTARTGTNRSDPGVVLRPWR
jgi:hypothetical protein